MPGPCAVAVVRRFALGGAVLGVLLREILDALTVGVKRHTLVVTVRTRLVGVVPSELLCDEDVGIPAAIISRDEDGLLTHPHPVVEPLYPALCICLESRVAAFRVGREDGFEGLLLLLAHGTYVAVEGAAVLQHDVHVTISPHVRVVAA